MNGAEEAFTNLSELFLPAYRCWLLLSITPHSSNLSAFVSPRLPLSHRSSKLDKQTTPQTSNSKLNNLPSLGIETAPSPSPYKLLYYRSKMLNNSHA